MTQPTDAQLMKGKGLMLTDSVGVIHPTLDQVVDNEEYEKNLPYLMYTSEEVADVLWVEHHVLYKDITNEWDFFVQQALVGSKPHDVYFEKDGIQYVNSDCLILNKDYRDALNYFLSLDCEYTVIEQTTGEIHQNVIYSLSVDGDRYIYRKKNFLFTQSFYMATVAYLRKVNSFYPDYYWKSAGTKKGMKIFLEQEYKKRQRHKGKKSDSGITLESIISGLVARGQPYNEIWDYPIYMVYNLFRRFQKIDEYNGTMQAVYSGNIDTSKHKIDWDKINWAAVIRNK